MNRIALTCVLLLAAFVGTGADAARGRNHDSEKHRVRIQKKAPELGSARRSLPDGHSLLKVAGRSYHYSGGFYYSQRGRRGAYIAVPPPRGARLRALPSGHIRVRAGARSYFYFGGAFYWWDPALSIYVSIGAPVGAVVPVLPPGYRTVIVAGTPHYVIGDDYYVYAPERDGYKVVEPQTSGSPVGSAPADQLKSLPSGFQTAQMQGEDLFVVDGVFYRYDASADIYVRTSPPPGTALKELRGSCEKVHLRGEETYLCKGVYYRYDPGQQLYIVVSSP